MRVKLVCCLTLLMVLVGCAGYKVHPGSVSTLDSQVYDSLIVAQSVIDDARTDLTLGKIPASTAPLINRIILAYSVTRDAWLTYRGAVVTKIPTNNYLNQLNQDLTDLTAAIASFKGAK